jgi:hypothetical protein
MGVGWCFGTIHKPVEVVTVEIGLELMMPNQVIGLGKFSN